MHTFGFEVHLALMASRTSTYFSHVVVGAARWNRVGERWYVAVRDFGFKDVGFRSFGFGLLGKGDFLDTLGMSNLSFFVAFVVILSCLGYSRFCGDR